MEKLFTAETTNTTSSVVVSKGKELTVQASGTWGSATVKLQISLTGVTYVDVTDLTWTADAIGSFQVPAGAYFRADISGGTAATLDVWVAGQGTD